MVRAEWERADDLHLEEDSHYDFYYVCQTAHKSIISTTRGPEFNQADFNAVNLTRVLRVSCDFTVQYFSKKQSHSKAVKDPQLIHITLVRVYAELRWRACINVKLSKSKIAPGRRF